MATIYRGGMTTLWLTLQSNETLGILDSAYIEDYFGNDGQVSLYHIASGTYYPVVMITQPAQTPTIGNDVFIGSYLFSLLPDGVYQIRGRVRDISGNYTILSTLQTPTGGEGVQTLGLTIASGFATIYVINAGPLVIRTGIDTGARFGLPSIEADLHFGLVKFSMVS
ncbi:MAG: hypothetical protein JKX92_05400 [Porticoccaceae bacterium]|nr:hypothetical protein [Porticoccaceae bacterium]